MQSVAVFTFTITKHLSIILELEILSYLSLEIIDIDSNGIKKRCYQFYKQKGFKNECLLIGRFKVFLNKHDV